MESHNAASNEQREDWEGFFNNPETILVSTEEYEWLCKELDGPPRELPRLRELLKEKPIWQVDD